MSGLQAIILDPAEVAAQGREELSLCEGGITPYYEGIDWGEQEIQPYTSEALYGNPLIDWRMQERIVKIPLVIRATAGMSFDAWRVKLQAKCGEVNFQGGGWLKRVLPSGREIFADVVSAKLHLSASWTAENTDLDREAMLELVCLPDFYGPEETLEALTGTGDASGVFQVKGDVPARVNSFTVTDTSGNDQHGLFWHFRRQHYSSAETAKWAYDAEKLGVLDISEKVTLSGSFGTKVVKHPKLSTEWTPILSTNLAGETFLTHAGLYNLWARVYSTSEALPWLRVVYGVGDIVNPEECEQAQVPRSNGYYLVNLGLLNLSSVAFGSQRWEGQIQGRGEEGGENVSIDRIWLQCADECSGAPTASSSSRSITSVVASDSLTGEGALAGSDAPRGGEWAESGEIEGFTRTAEGATREHKEDSEGHTATLSESTVGAVTIRGEVRSNALADNLTRGFYLRYSSSTYWVRVVLRLEEYHKGGRERVLVEHSEGAGTESQILATVSSSTAFRTLQASIDANGLVTASLDGVATGSYSLPTFAHGGSYAEGKIGIYDYNPSGAKIIRTYRNITASPIPNGDAVMYADKSARLSSTGMWRESEDGKGFGPIGYPGSDLPRLPVSGPSEGPVEVAVKPSRGDFSEQPDAGIDGVKFQISYSPCYGTIPEE